jgi:hypothetical protein
MAKQKLSEIAIETWNIDSQYPDGTPDAKGTVMGVYAHNYDSHAKSVFSILEKDGKVEAVVKLDRLKENRIPVYLEVGDNKILVQP